MPATLRCPATRPSLLLRIRDDQARDAWAIFVDTYVPLIYGYCRKRGLQEADARDVVQEVLLRIRCFEYQPERGQFRAWLATVTRHEIGRLRARLGRPGQGVGGPDGGIDGAATGAAAEHLDWERLYQARLLEVALARIRPEFTAEQWGAFEAVALRPDPTGDRAGLIWVERPPYGRVAAELGRPVAWVYKVKSLVLRRLKGEVLYLAEDLALIA
jgi:RNA polymerase sigma-70 factor (ECF subfamily)